MALPKSRPGQEEWFDNRDAELLAQSGEFGGRRRRSLEGILPSGSIAIDAALGIGGLPRGRIMELFGGPSVGKTTLGLQIIAAVQCSGLTAAFLDAEHTFDPAYAAKVGVNIESLLFTQSNDGEQAFRILEKLAHCKAIDLIVVDSVAALCPSAAEEHVAFAQSEMIASGLRRLARAMASSPCGVLLLNQVRDYHGFGYDETTPGGWAVKLHATIRAALREKRRLTSGKRRLEFRVLKNQLAPAQQLEFVFADGIGVSPEDDLIDMGISSGVLQRNDSGLCFDGVHLGADRQEVVHRLTLHTTLSAEINAAIRLASGITQRRPAARSGVPARALRQNAAG